MSLFERHNHIRVAPIAGHINDVIVAAPDADASRAGGAWCCPDPLVEHILARAVDIVAQHALELGHLARA